MNYSITHINANESQGHLKVNESNILHFGEATEYLKSYNALQQKRSNLTYNSWTKSNWNLAFYFMKKSREQLTESI